MSAPNLNYAWARALLDALCEGGVAHAVVCPGSRSAPLALSCAEHPALRTWSIVDERSAGFFALGLALATGRPAILVATSGSAGAHFLPALIEAAQSQVPLVVLTADRPWELHGFGAPQTVPQERLYGEYARAFESLPVPEPSSAAFTHLRAVAARAVAVARRAPRGAVHLNVPFREPLAPTPDGVELPDAAGPHLAFAPGERTPSPAALDEIAARAARTPRGLVVCGPRAPDARFAHAVHRLAKRLGYPVVAEAASNARFGADEGVAIAHADLLLQHAPFADARRPRLVLRFGGGLTSRRLQAWLDASGAESVLFSDGGALFDPSHRASWAVEGDAAASADGLTARLERAEREPRRDEGWAAGWVAADRAVRAALDAAFAADARLTEPRIAREVAAVLPAGAQLFVSSSMPVRELDAFAAPERPALRVFANRGANGIDGVTSSALGAAAGTGQRTVLLTGDLAFLHDLGGLWAAHRHRLPLVAVVVNNDGGGIFSFLPIATATPRFEELFATPHGLDLSHAARLFGGEHHRPGTAAELREAIRAGLEGGLHIVEVKVPRAENPAVHRALADAARAALLAEGAP